MMKHAHSRVFLQSVFVTTLLFSSCSSNPRRWPASNPATTRIVAFGDSHFVGSFGMKLDRLLRTIKDSSVNFYGSCGTIAKSWTNGRPTNCGSYQHPEGFVERIEREAQTPQLFTAWKNFDNEKIAGILTVKPTHVIVEFGANYSGYNDMFIETDFDNLFSNIAKVGAQCFLISMPDTRHQKVRDRQDTIVQIAERAAQGRCTFFNSTKVTTYPPTGGDGIHYAREPELVQMGEAWAEAAFKEFKKSAGL